MLRHKNVCANIWNIWNNLAIDYDLNYMQVYYKFYINSYIKGMAKMRCTPVMELFDKIVYSF